MTLDGTHDPDRRSWVETANDPETDFPLQNLPLGCGRGPGGGVTTVVAIGELILDAGRAAATGLLDGTAAEVVRESGRLNGVLARPGHELTALRHALTTLLERGSPHAAAIRDDGQMLLEAEQVQLLTPTEIGSFTDFFAGIYHARAVSEILVPGGDVGPNYRWVPIAYQSRAGTVSVSGHRVRRPAGQLLRPSGQPEFAPCEMLDFELEMGFYVGAGAEAGRPVAIADADRHVAGFCLLNDWSARDIQRWEMAPLGPFLSKSFATTISPWVVTADALKPFRAPAMPRAGGEPRPLPYLDDPQDQAAGGLSVQLSVWLCTERMRADGEPPALLLRSDARHLYWTPAQMLAHHTSNGCSLQPGDLLGTGTISGPAPDELGSLLELTEDARRPAVLPNGETRGYLQDGDEVTLAGRCVRDGFASIGFGPCTATVASADSLL
ncbi:MAG TPA: fumarylacetoacetase [Solirubrobacteraceae bacterium]|nr:fumarylacetoacetase [Solirubrobacteraceae bacterium]